MANYKSSYTGAEIDAGIAKANTALQEHQDISGKVDKETGKGLSTNDYTTAEKTKLAGIDMSTKQDTLVSGENIKTVNNQSLLGNGNINIEGSGTDKYLEDAEIVQEQGEPITENKDISFGLIDTASSNSRSDLGTFWNTNFPAMQEIFGKKLNSITLTGATAGTFTIRGYDAEIDKTESNANLQRASTTANTNGYDIITIALETGKQTYLLDGTDSRVTIVNQNAINSCPKTIGLTKSGDTGTVKYNQTGITDNGYKYFAFSGSTSYTNVQSLAFDINYEDETTSITTNLKLIMNDGVIHRVNLSDITIEPEIVDSYPLEGKKLSILGDSISTYQGYIPSGYAYYYPRYGIDNVEKTWWKQLINETKLTLLKNASWSGSYVTGDSTSTTNAIAACSDKRISDLADGTTTPDIIVCYIGINDFGQNVHRQLGDYTGLTTIPSEGTIETLSEAYGLMLYKVMSTYPNAKVYACSLMETSSAQWDTGGAGVFPTINNNNVTVSSFNERIKTIATNLGAGFIDIHSCGIHYWNLSTYTGDGLHPNTEGAKLVKERVKSALLNDAE